MILVLLGTNPYPFTRLMEQVIKYVEKTGERVVVQSGNTPVEHADIEATNFIGHDRLMELISEAELVITQGGFGSLQDCIKQGARTIAVPRLVDLGESMDDQTEIVDALAAEKLVIPLYEVAKLEEAIVMAKNMQIDAVNDYKLPKHVAETIHSMLGK